MRQITYDLDESYEDTTIGRKTVITKIPFGDDTIVERVAKLRGENPDELLAYLIHRSIYELRKAYETELQQEPK